jgi:molecular chaperone GrpE
VLAIRGCFAETTAVSTQPLGQKFDPNAHEALFQMDDPTKEPGTVAVVQKPGYTINGRTLRAAVVGVIREQQ